MRVSPRIVLASFLCWPLVAGDPAAAPADPQSLFDGATLSGWDGDSKHWRVEGGAITGEIPAGQTLARNQFLFWKGDVRDFELTLEYRISGDPSANSGIQFRCQRHEGGGAAGYQADLDDGAVWLGRIYDEDGRALILERGTRVSIAPDGRRWADPFADPKSFGAVPRAGDWNTYRVRAAGSHMEVWINGVFFGALDDHESGAAEYSGRLAFQLHAGKGPARVEFRHIQLRDLGSSDLPPPLVAPTPKVSPEEAPIPPVGEDGKPLNLGFEKGTLDDWTAQGDAWERQPIRGDTVKRRKPGESSHHAGDYWVGGYEPRSSDAATGQMTSRAFTVTQPWGSFLIGGGGNVAEERMELVQESSGKVFHTATGQNVEDLRREVVDLRPVHGERIFIRLIDGSQGGWGHLNFDDFVFHARPPSSATGLAGKGRQSESPVLWHLRPNPAKSTAIANAEAQKTVADMLLTHGFQAELIAAEPDVRQPIAFAIDEKGRLWVLEGHSYPNKRPEGKGQDRVVIFADGDGDGSFETRKVFMEGLNLASGIEVGHGGVWIGAAPELLFIPDRDHDDRPDGPPKTLLDGWGYQDTHETLNSLTWGPDGWLYGLQGVFTKSLVGKPGTPPDKRIAMRAGVWRYHPVRHELEVFAHGGSNQWGLDYSSTGQFFMTHCRSFFGGGGTTHVIRNGHFWNQANANYAPFISANGTSFAPGLRNYLPASARYDSGEGGAGKPGTTAIYGGHSHVGTLIYQGDNWPAIYRDHLFTHNLHGHQINQQVNVRQGSGYETMHAGADLLHAPDPRYIAVDLQTGPDGSVYVIDWYDQQHCHSPVEEKWDRTNGRIYRISWAATYRAVQVDLGAKSSLELVRLQTHPNEWFGRTARRLLQERAAAGPLDKNAIAALGELASSADPTTALRGLWTLHQTVGLDAHAYSAFLAHASDLVRAWAVALATERPQQPALNAIVLQGLALQDPSATVRLALASALPHLSPGDVWDLAGVLATHAEDASDRFLPKLIWSGLARVAAQDFSRALDLAAKTPLIDLADSIHWFAASSPEGREALFERLTTLPEPQLARVARIAAFALRNEPSLAAPRAWPRGRERLLQIRDTALQSDLEQLSALFGDRDLLAQKRAILADGSQRLEARKAAFELLQRVGDAEALPIFLGLLDQSDFRSSVIPLLGRINAPSTAETLLSRFASLQSADRAAALAVLTSRASFAWPLVQAMVAGTFDKKELTGLHVRQLRSLRDARINQVLEKTWGSFKETSEAAGATILRVKKAFTEAPLWAYESEKGKAVFDRVCSACHAMGGDVQKVGPNLAGSSKNGLDYFLENIVDPNAVVGEDFFLTVLVKKDGSIVSGMIEKETESSLLLRTITESVLVQKSEIQETQKAEQSLMPPGLLETLGEREVIELLKYLTNA